MRFKIPWSETAVIAAIYAAFTVWSGRGWTLLGAAVLAAALATTLLSRAITRSLSVRSSAVQIALAASAFGAIAAAITVGGPVALPRKLAVIELAARSLSLGGAMLLSLTLGADDRRRPRATLISCIFALAIVTATARPHLLPSWFPALVQLAPCLVAVVLLARHAAHPDPVQHANLLIPAAGATVSAVLVAASVSPVAALRHTDTLLAATATMVLWTAVTVGAAQRWASHGRTLVRYVVAASAGCAAAAVFASFTDRSLASGLVGAAVGTLFVPVTAMRAFLPDHGRLLSACAQVDAAVVSAERLEDVATAVLGPLRQAGRDLRAPAELWILPTEARYTLDVSGAAHAGKLSPALERALLAWMRSRRGEIVFADVLLPLEVRRPELRPLIELLREHEAFAAVPIQDADDLTAVVLIPRGRRTALPRLEEQRALQDLAVRVSASVAMSLALERAHARASEAGERASQAEAAKEKAEVERERAQMRIRTSRAARPIGSLESTWVGYSETMRTLEAKLRALATASTHLALIAEPGTNVAAIARYIHEASGRSAEPCVLLDSSRIHPRDALVTLVGAVAAPDPEDPAIMVPEQAGWLELAGEGTLMILDVPALGYDAHVALTEAFKSGTARSVGASTTFPTRARLVLVCRSAALDAGLPTELCERIGASSITVPPLRERPEDLENLVLFGIDRGCRILGRGALGIRPQALSALKAYPWPGNEEELYATLESAVRFTRGPHLVVDDLPPHVRGPGRSDGRASVPPPDGRDGELETYDAMERRILQSALDRAGGNKSEAARVLGMARTTLLDKLRKYGLRA